MYRKDDISRQRQLSIHHVLCILYHASCIMHMDDLKTKRICTLPEGTQRWTYSALRYFFKTIPKKIHLWGNTTANYPAQQNSLISVMFCLPLLSPSLFCSILSFIWQAQILSMACWSFCKVCWSPWKGIISCWSSIVLRFEYYHKIIRGETILPVSNNKNVTVGSL